MHQEQQFTPLYQEYFPETQESSSSGASKLLWTTWCVICAIGLLIMYGLKQKTAGALIIAVPTGIGMLLNVNFALYIFIITYPMFSSLALIENISLPKVVGYILLLSFILNAMGGKITIRLNVIVGLVISFFAAVIFSVFINESIIILRNSIFTYFQLVVFFCMVYWILYQGGNRVLLVAARSYLIGTICLVSLTVLTGMATASMMEEESSGRLTAGLGGEVNANELAVYLGTGLVIAIYLLQKDRNLFWKIASVFCLLVFPLTMILTGSRGSLVALAGVFVLPYIFTLKPKFNFKVIFGFLALLCLSAGVIIIELQKVGMGEGLKEHLIGQQQIESAFSFRMYLNKTAVAMAIKRPLGAGLTNWPVYTGLDRYPHNDFCYNLGVYGVPAGLCLFLIWMVLGIKLKKLPYSKEKALARGLWIFYLIIGLKGMYTPTKLYWLILAFITVIVGSENWRDSFHDEQRPEDEDVCLNDPMTTNT